ncbi:unnamed protein product [Linum trigynum]|uniref:Reverse transcriptase domain-containing protein n=1 Tax=Linum trigynum TaxID=586398 RepID=A0AAV2DFY6_9ROSI
MDKRKAPGPDVMSVLFFHRYWHIVGDDVVNTVFMILEIGVMPENLNHTLIALIPKVKVLTTPKEFRPISLCNVIYKLVAKVLANRMKLVLDLVISEEQSAFVPGRYITDNIMAVFECFHSMKQKRKGGQGFFAAKIDMAKAYDRVEWHFLEGVMNHMGFSERWCRLVMMCVKTVTYAVLVNGHQSPSFIPIRGLRQGDTLSPYLFLLCAEGLSAYTKAAVQHKRFYGISPARGAPTVTHLFFADDSVFFGRANAHDSSTLKHILQAYERESGQMVNLQKSEVSFSGKVKPHQRESLE